jgi:hypothetical protein
MFPVRYGLDLYIVFIRNRLQMRAVKDSETRVTVLARTRTNLYEPSVFRWLQPFELGRRQIILKVCDICRKIPLLLSLKCFQMKK